MIDWPLVSDYAVAFAVGYLCGSVPFGVVLTRR
jgi:glycerol-3-phosphate acyltransferase PlsY